MVSIRSCLAHPSILSYTPILFAQHGPIRIGPTSQVSRECGHVPQRWPRGRRTTFGARHARQSTRLPQVSADDTWRHHPRHGPVSATWTQTVASVEIGSVSWNFRSLVTASSLSWPRSRDTSYVMTRWRCSGHSFRICRGGSRNGSWRKSWQSRKSPPSHPAISTRSVSAPRAPSKIGTSRASPLLPRPSSFFVSSLSHRRDAIKEAAAFNSPSVEWCYQFSARAPIVNNPTLLFEVAPSASLCHLGFQLTEISSLSSFLFCVLLAAPRQDETSFI